MCTKSFFRSLVTILMFLVFYTNSVYSQNVAVPTNNILYSKKPSISSPNAAAIEKYTEFPTANYTGVPAISIPVTQISLKGLGVPVVLSYHAGGIKVEEVSSDVGIGWSLVAGGSINILANGILDESPASGYPTGDPANFEKIKTLNFVQSYSGGLIDCFTAQEYSQGIFGGDPLDLYTGGDMVFLRGVVRQNQDAEPDMYSFNFLGRSGKFFADENGVFRTIPASALKIERVIVSNLATGYKVTDENGVIYEFKIKEESAETYYNNSVSIFNIDYSNTKTSVSYNLSKITTPTGESVDLYYSQYLLTYDLQKTFSRARFPTSAIATSCWQFNGYGSYYYSTYTTASKEVGAQRLDSIKSSDGSLIKFLYSANNRTDLPGAKALEKIETWNYAGDRTMINQSTLVQDYSTGRLTLKSMQELGKPATEFVYNNQALPDRLSYSQDAYGFYNQKTNLNTLLPKDEYMEFWDGADRSVMPDFTQAGMLTKIKHPTGGSTEYLYEPNEFYVDATTTTYPKVLAAYLVSSPNQTVSTTFTVTANSKKLRMNYTDSWEGNTINNDYCIIHITGSNNFQLNFTDTSSLNTPPLNLPPGQYTLSIENVGSTYIAEAALFWFEETQVAPHNEIGGGVRIKEIKKYEKDGSLALHKKFEYKQTGNSNSSGINNASPIFTAYKDQIINSAGSSTCYTTYCQFISQNSNSISPLTFANGSYVLYKDVTTYLKDKTENGYSSYKYNISTNGFNTGIPSFPYAPSVPYDWVNGMLLEQNDYAYKNSQFIPTRKLKNYYNYTVFDPVVNTSQLYKTFGAKIAIQNEPYICVSECQYLQAANLSNMSFGIQQYKFYSSPSRIDKTDETIYDENGANPLTKTINNFYDNVNNLQATRTEINNSKGEIVKTINRTPLEKTDIQAAMPLTTAEAATIDEMVSRNIISPVLQTEQYKGGNLLNRSLTTYKNWGGTILMPEKIKFQNVGGTLKTKITFNAYDNAGNLLEEQKVNDVAESFIYDYQNRYPVAVATNTTKDNIAYTSFESDGTGNFTISSTAAVIDATAPSGKKSFPLSIGYLSKTIDASKTYIVSLWKTGTLNISGSTLYRTGRTINGWTYVEYQVSNTSFLSISGTGNIDELRLYPKNAQMTSYTYEPLIGMTSQSDANGNILYYEYDAFGRLKYVRDMDKNIVKVMEYKYKAGVLE